MDSFKTELIRHNIDRIILEFLTDGHAEQYKDLDQYLEVLAKEHTNLDLTLEDLIPTISKLSPEHSAIMDKLNGMYSGIKNSLFITKKKYFGFCPVVGNPDFDGDAANIILPPTQKKELPEIEESDVELVISQTGATFLSALKALLKNDGDIVNAIMELTDPIESKTESNVPPIPTQIKFEEYVATLNSVDDGINYEVSDEEEFGITI